MKNSKSIRDLKDNEKSRYFEKALRYAFNDTDARGHYGINGWINYLLERVILEDEIEGQKGKGDLKMKDIYTQRKESLLQKSEKYYNKYVKAIIKGYFYMAERYAYKSIKFRAKYEKQNQK